MTISRENLTLFNSINDLMMNQEYSVKVSLFDSLFLIAVGAMSIKTSKVESKMLLKQLWLQLETSACT